MANKEKNDNLGPEKFEFVQRDEKIYDKRFETKPIGYFKDAMIRFSKNKTNLIASSILLTLLLLGIFIPMLTTKNYSDLEVQLQYLPPRVPLLEKIGILDGTKKYTGQVANLDSYDEELGLYFPVGFDEELILRESLENYEVSCTDKNESCLGGTLDLVLDRDDSIMIYTKQDTMIFDASENSTLAVEVVKFSSEDPDAKMTVSLSYNYGSSTAVLGEITEPGIYSYNVFDVVDSTNELVSSALSFEINASENSSTTVGLKEVKLESDSDEELYSFSDIGYALSQYKVSPSGAGLALRNNGKMIQTAFKYNVYEQVFGEREEKVFSKEKFDQIMIDYQDVCTLPENMDNIAGWQFEEGCPIKEVYDQTEPLVGPNDEIFYSYHLLLDYAVYSGYDDIPYFLFGTNAGGKDFFALVWLGLRTSLFIGLVVALINISIGIVYGAIEGYYGGTVDLLMERFGEIVGRIPFLVWLGLFVIWLGPGLLTLVVLLTVTGWLGVASTTRTQFYRYKGREYVLASRTMGAKDSRLIFRHILPNGIGTIITASILMIPGVIFAESTISYLGYGIGYGQNFKLLGLFELSGVSIGVLLADGRTQLVDKPYLTAFPSLIISILMITFNMFGNALRDAFNPSLRGSE